MLIRLTTNKGEIFMVSEDFEYAYGKPNGKETSFQYDKERFSVVPLPLRQIADQLPKKWMIRPNDPASLTDDSCLCEVITKEETVALINVERIVSIRPDKGGVSRIEFESGRFLLIGNDSNFLNAQFDPWVIADIKEEKN